MLFEIEGTGFDRLLLLVKIGKEENKLGGELELEAKGHCISVDGTQGSTFDACDDVKFKDFVRGVCDCI
jgi:hypothetical protein